MTCMHLVLLISSNHGLWTVFRDYYNKDTKTKKMAEATTLYLGTITGNKDFLAKLRKFFDRFFKDIDEAAQRLPGFLKVH